MSPMLITNLKLSDPALVDWLAGVLEFQIAERTPTEDGAGLAHVQLWLGDQCLMASTVGKLLDLPLGVASIYLALEHEDDVRRRYDRAIAAGGEPVMAPEAVGYGGISATFRDRDGNAWSLGTYVPGRQS